jgi:stage V sporulation protein R
MTIWTIADLEYWDARIQEKVAAFGLDCYPQEFEVCDQNAMLGYMAYHGMPSHYPHWSFGKSFEQTKTMALPACRTRWSSTRIPASPT